MIFAGAWQGDIISWQQYMLIGSHLGMALEALLYFRFMRAGIAPLLVATAWILLNDTMDYTYNIFPYLSGKLYDDLPAVEAFTYGLSIFSFGAALLVWYYRKKV